MARQARDKDKPKHPCVKFAQLLMILLSIFGICAVIIFPMLDVNPGAKLDEFVEKVENRNNIWWIQRDAYAVHDCHKVINDQISIIIYYLLFKILRLKRTSCRKYRNLIDVVYCLDFVLGKYLINGFAFWRKFGVASFISICIATLCVLTSRSVHQSSISQ